ncbi:MAG: hypothetical protein GXC72_01095 [Chitinophagaceae bacterium]|nr:hypothetical protein [Chitinophagaceae bacterium]
MKINKSLLIALGLTVLLSSVYRIVPDRPLGFAPQIAIALFGGAFFVKNKKWAFALPLLSMFLSDLLYQAMYVAGYTDIQGFYSGQWVNYLLFTGLTAFGFLLNSRKVIQVIGAALAAPTAYFLTSNFLVWIGNGGYGRPKTFSGLMQCYADGIPFYGNSVVATLVFAGMLFGGFLLIEKKSVSSQQA